MTADMRIFTILLTLLLLCGRADGGSDMEARFLDLSGAERKWTVGFGRVEIPIPETDSPLYIAGYRNGYEITGVHDLQRASAVWLDCGGAGVLLIGIDCVGLSNKCVEDIRALLADECLTWGCASVNVFSTHTHAGIDTLGLWGNIASDGKNPEFMENVVSAAAEAARLAHDDRRAGKLSYAKIRTEDVQRDSRDPQVYDEYLYQFRFAPDDNSRGVRIVSFGAHAEALGSQNTLVSRDFPGFMADYIMEDTGDELLFMPGAIGGLIMTRDFCEDGGTKLENAARTGRCLANYLLSIAEDTPLAPDMKLARVTFSVPLDNVVFLLYRNLGILENAAVPGGGETGYALMTELSILTLGDCALALIPGEIFPELVCGGYLQTDSAAENPAPLVEIADKYGVKNLVICGLANDEIGYIIPPNDFVVADSAPYITRAPGSHYEETNSVGIGAARAIAEAFEAALARIK